MRPEQTFSELVGEVLSRQAQTLATHTGKPLESALEEARDTPAGRQLKRLAESEVGGQRAAVWQARPPWRRSEERHYSWLESYMKWLEGKESRAQYHTLLKEEFASLRG